jgi:chromosome partitioning protein
LYTIVINSQKGGSGKTMLAKHLAVAAELAGDGPVYLIDTDPQGSLTAWHSKREMDIPALVEVSFAGLAGGLEQIARRGAGLTIIDTASGRIEVAERLSGLADLVIFPVQASEDDLAAAPVTVALLKAGKVPFLFVVTRVRTNTLITAQAAALLSAHGRVAATFVTDRTAYKSPYAGGKTVIEASPSGAAALEMAALWQNIKTTLVASNKRGKKKNG